MTELTDSGFQEKATLLEPHGKRVIGVRNPEKMTKREFENSPELLFHGSEKSIQFDQKFDYQNPDYLLSTDGSSTLGFGLYTTPYKLAAESYSSTRNSVKGSPKLGVTSFIAKEAVMFDFRDRLTLQRNAPVPTNLFNKWREKFVRYFKDRDLDQITISQEIMEPKYLKHLDKLSELPNIDLRAMLWTSSDKRLVDGSYPSPPWMFLFSQFMRDEGYDGIIYIEGGDNKQNKYYSPTFCFYSLERINTFKGWHNE